MKRSSLIFIVSICIALAGRGFTQDRNRASITVLPLLAPAGELQCAGDFRASLSAALAGKGLDTVVRDDIAFDAGAHSYAGTPDSEIFASSAITGSHALAAEIIPVNGKTADAGAARGAAAVTMCLVRVCLYSVPDRRFVYVSEDYGMLPDEAGKLAATLAGRTALFLQGRIPGITGVKAAASNPPDGVTISWESPAPGVSFVVTRSRLIDGPREIAGETSSMEFTDRAGEQAVVYYYRVSGVVDGVVCDPSPAVKGYRKSAPPASEDLDAIINARKKKYPEPADPAEKARIERDFAVMSQFSVNLFSINFILNIVRQYLKSGQVIALSNVAQFTVDRAERTVYLVYPGKCVIKLFSGRLFRFYNQCPPTDDPLSVTFGVSGNAKDYIGSGWLSPEESMTRTDGARAEMLVPFKAEGKSPMLDMYVSQIVFAGPYKPYGVAVTVNDSIGAHFRIKEKGRYSVPLDYVSPAGGEPLRLGFHFYEGNFPAASGQDIDRKNRFSVAMEKVLVYPYIEQNDLFKRIIENSVVFAVQGQDNREMNVTLKDGVEMSLPVYEGVGMATQYYRDSADWKKNALLFESSDEDIRAKIKEAAKSLKK